MVMTPNAFAQRALDWAGQCAVARAHPWIIWPKDLGELMTLFYEDFDREITQPGDYERWRPRIERLFGHVGTASAFIAEAGKKNVQVAAGNVSLDDLVLACQLVKEHICPFMDPEGLRICQKAPIFANAQFKALGQAVAMYKELIGSLSGSTPPPANPGR